MSTTPDECARQVLETVPMVMRSIRFEMRRNKKPELSVPQFRVLIFLDRNKGASLSYVAEHMGISLAATSKMVDGLATRNLVSREMHSKDRRRVSLAVTQAGRVLMRSAREATQARLVERMTDLSLTERAIIVRAMQALGSILTPDQKIKI